MADNQVNIVITAVNKTKAAFNELNKDLKGLQDEGKATKAEIAAAGAVIVGAITAIGVTAVTKFADFEASMSKVKAVTDATTDEMRLLTDQAKELGASTIFTSKEVADAMMELGQAGFTTAEIMKAIPATLDLAAAGGLGIARATEIASSTLRGFQIDTKNTTHVVDVMAKVAATSNASIESFGEAMKYFAPTAHAFNVSLEESSAVVGILSNAGIQGSLATRALGTSLARLTKPTKAMIGKMEELGLTFFDAEGEFVGMGGAISRLETAFVGLTQEQKMNAISTLFGMEAIQEWNVLLAAGGGALDKYTEQLESSDGAAKKMAETMLDNLNGAFEQLNGAVDTIYINLGGLLAPAVRAVAVALTVLANVIGDTLALVAKLPAPVQMFLGVFVGLVAAVVAGVAAWAALSVTLGGVFTAFLTIIGAAAALTGGLLPLIGIIAAVAAVAALLYYAWTTNFMGIQDMVYSFVTQISAFLELLKFAWDNNWYGMQSVVMGVWSAIVLNFKIIWEIFKGIVNVAMALLNNDWRLAWEIVQQTVMNVFALIVEAATGFWGALGALWNAGVSLLSDGWSGFMEGIQSIATSIWDGIKKVFTDGINWIIDKMNGFIRGISAVSSAVGKAIGQKGWSIPEIPRMAHGGIVPEPHGYSGGGLVKGPMGTDTTLIAASPGERVLTRSQSANLSSQLARGGGGSLHLHFDGAVFNGSGQEFIEEVADKMWKMAAPHIPHEAF